MKKKILIKEVEIAKEKDLKGFQEVKIIANGFELTYSEILEEEDVKKELEKDLKALT